MKSHPGGPPYDRHHYETLDYIIVPDRWKNTVENVEIDMNSGINSYHYPLRVTICINLKAKYEKTKTKDQIRIR